VHELVIIEIGHIDARFKHEARPFLTDLREFPKIFTVWSE